MPRIFLPSVVLKENQISITGEKAHYLVSVLRCREGDDLVVVGGEGNCFKTKIIESGRREVIAEVIDNFPCNLESSLDIILVQGLLKGQKMDMVIQKTTELGVKEIVPVITMRSQLTETRKITRWEKIAEEAARQSGRSVVPRIPEPVEFSHFLSVYASRFMSHGFIFYEEGGMKLSEATERLREFFGTDISALPIKRPYAWNQGDTLSAPPPSKGREVPSSPVREDNDEGEARHGEGSGISPNILVVIGPEGGFTKEEVNLAEEKGLLVISLGRRILRAETAAVSAVALVQFLFGDIG